MNSLKESMKGQAENKIKVGLVLEAVAKAENLTVSDEDFEAELARMAEMYHMEIDKIKETIGSEEKESIMQDMLNQRAMDLIVEASVEK